MSKSNRRRVARLEAWLGPEDTRDTGDPRKWLEALDDWPDEYLGSSWKSSEQEVIELREECRKIAARVRAFRGNIMGTLFMVCSKRRDGRSYCRVHHHP